MAVMLWYIASPYSRYERGTEAAFIDACTATAALMRQGFAVYSPIAHTHPIAIHGGMDPLDHEIWMPLDAHMMARCDGLVVVMMPGWRESKGIGIEIDAFEKAGKPIRYIEWPIA